VVDDEDLFVGLLFHRGCERRCLVGETCWNDWQGNSCSCFWTQHWQKMFKMFFLGWKERL